MILTNHSCHFKGVELVYLIKLGPHHATSQHCIVTNNLRGGNTCTWEYTYAHTHTHTHTHTNIDTHPHKHTRTHINTHNIDACTHTCVCTHTCIRPTSWTKAISRNQALTSLLAGLHLV